ncbi:MAG: sulfatase-like hydrolase/transferase, partial [Thermoleophilaceae bacterium]
RLWRQLREEGLWDDALIVVAADHGVAFPLGRPERRRLRRDTAAAIAPVPLLVKAPGQRRGRVDDAWVETIDILPTIFDVLDLDPRVEMDGRSAFSPAVQRRDELRMLIRNTFEVLRIPADEFERERRAVVERNLELFGTGRDGPERIYRIGPNQELLGEPASAVGERLDVDFVYAADYEEVDLQSPFLPTQVVGLVRGDRAPGRDIAVAVNGTIVAVGNTFELAAGEEGEIVSVMAPPGAFRQGRNRVEVYEVP